MLGTADRGRREVPVVGVLVALGTLDGRDPDPPEVLAAAASSLPERLAMLGGVVDVPELDALHDRAPPLDDLAGLRRAGCSQRAVRCFYARELRVRGGRAAG